MLTIYTTKITPNHSAININSQSPIATTPSQHKNNHPANQNHPSPSPSTPNPQTRLPQLQLRIRDITPLRKPTKPTPRQHLNRKQHPRLTRLHANIQPCVLRNRIINTVQHIHRNRARSIRHGQIHRILPALGPLRRQHHDHVSALFAFPHHELAAARVDRVGGGVEVGRVDGRGVLAEPV